MGNPARSLLGSVCGVLASALLAAGCGGAPREPVPAAPEVDEPEAPAPAASAAPPEPEPAPVVSRASLGRGGTLDATLRKLGVPDDLRHAIVAEFGRHLDLGRLPRSTGVSVSLDPEGRLVRASCRARLEDYVRVERNEDGTLDSETVEVPVSRDLESIAGVIDSSVARAFAEHRHGTALTLAYADIFQWDVDLLVDPRPGDRIRTVFESLRLDAPPPDLPRFGSRGIETGAEIGLGRILAASYEGARVTSKAYWIAEDGNGGGYYDGRGDSMRKTFLKSPLDYRRISSGFSRARRHPITRRVIPHHGVDFAAAPGTAVVAAADGRVIAAGWQGALGRAVRLRHGHDYETVYGHLRALRRGIRAGKSVRQNEVIGYVGSSGRATGPHLHYSLIVRGRPINPLTFPNPPSAPLDPALMPRLRAVRSDLDPVLLAAPFVGEDTEIAESEPVESVEPSS